MSKKFLIELSGVQDERSYSEYAVTNGYHTWYAEYYDDEISVEGELEDALREFNRVYKECKSKTQDFKQEELKMVRVSDKIPYIWYAEDGSFCLRVVEV